MKRSEARFFINWQMSRDDAEALHRATTDQERTTLLEQWMSKSHALMTAAEVDDENHWKVIISFFEGHYDQAKKAGFT